MGYSWVVSYVHGTKRTTNSVALECPAGIVRLRSEVGSTMYAAIRPPQQSVVVRPRQNPRRSSDLSRNLIPVPIMLIVVCTRIITKVGEGALAHFLR